MNIRAKIIIVVALLAIGACNEKEPTVIGCDENKTPIDFGSISTRALVTSINQVNEFGVSCAISNEDNTDYGSIMDNIKVARSSKSDTGWDYTPKSYWLGDSHYYFIASYPYLEDGGFQEEEGVIDGVNRVGYSLDIDTKSQQTDILTSSKYVNTSDSWTTNVVQLQFRHLLTNINFHITQANSDIENDYFIQSVSLYGISTSGTYSLIPEEDNIIENWVMDAPNNEANAFRRIFNDNTPLKGRTVSVWEQEGGLLVLPQRINNRASHIKIDYLYKLKTDEGNSDPVLKSILVDIPATDQWVSGNKIKYTLSFANPNTILFRNITVKSWGDAQSAGTIIID